MLVSIVTTLLLVLIGLWLIARFYLIGPSHTHYDTPIPPLTGKDGPPSQAHLDAVASMKGGFANPPKASRADTLKFMREQMDAMGQDVSFDGKIVPVDIDGLPAEWVLAPHADPAHRLLYVHGGGWTAGSPLSHRAVTTEYASRLGVAVLAIDYRLVPEYPRLAGIEDCQRAYRWLLENGPDGASPAQSLVVSGDSAGGNFTLMLTAWARDEGLRAADAAVALSPATDATFTSPTLKSNLETDAMLGPMMGQVLKMPKWIMMWGALLQNRVRPTNPLMSPLHGDLRNLPPTLLQASTAEMLEGDSVRYFNKAKEQGSAVTLELWPHMLHVWHIFVRSQPEAKDAFDHIEAFIRRNVTNLPG